MGKRTANDLDWPWPARGALPVLGLALLLGGAAGILLAALAGGEGAGALSGYLADYLRLAGQGGASAGLWPLLWDHLRCLLAALILGTTALGAVGLPALFAVRGFFFAFSVGCFCRVFGGAGLLPAFALFGLSALLWMPALFLAGVPGLVRARRLMTGGGQGGAGVSWARLALCGGLILAAVLTERWVAPVLLRAAARVVL